MTHDRARRQATTLWIMLAVVVWNGLYDLRITLGIRDYLVAQAFHEAGRGPAVNMSEAMAATVRDALLVASLWGSLLLAAALWTMRSLTVTRQREGSPP